ncbi:hypothetical protein ABK040_008925 [Willaertia magna]
MILLNSTIQCCSEEKFIQYWESNHHKLFLSQNKQVFSFGKCFEALYCGEDFLDHKTLTLLSSLKNIAQIRSSKVNYNVHGSSKFKYFSLALTEGGDILSWGGNEYGQLGHSKGKKAGFYESLISSLYGENICQIDCGSTVAIALSKENSSDTLMEAINNNYFSDLKLIFLKENNNEILSEFYLHNCILLARCPILLFLIQNGYLSLFLYLIFNKNTNKISEHLNKLKDKCDIEQFRDVDGLNKKRKVIYIYCTEDEHFEGLN